MSPGYSGSHPSTFRVTSLETGLSTPTAPRGYEDLATPPPLSPPAPA